MGSFGDIVENESPQILYIWAKSCVIPWKATTLTNIQP